MKYLLLLPLVEQGLAILLDEFYFHFYALSSQASVSSLVGSRHDWTSRHFSAPRFRLEVLLFAIPARHPGYSGYRASELLKALRAPWRICRTSTRLGFFAIR